jgi:hypothetical protein
MKNPLSLISVALGAITLGALALVSSGMVPSGSLTSDITYDSVFYMGLGPGGMERMIVYPALMWLAGSADTYLRSEKHKKTFCICQSGFCVAEGL